MIAYFIVLGVGLATGFLLALAAAVLTHDAWCPEERHKVRFVGRRWQ